VEWYGPAWHTGTFLTAWKAYRYLFVSQLENSICTCISYTIFRSAITLQ